MPDYEALSDRETRERYRSTGVWQERGIHELVDAVAAQMPEKEAVCDQSRRLTYADLVAESTSFARFLLDSGVDDGACVALQTPNAVELAIVHLGCRRAGATFVPLSPAWGPRELRHLLGLSRAAVALLPAATDTGGVHVELAELRRELPNLSLLATLGGDGDVDVREILARPRSRLVRAADPDAPRYVMVSSGTTTLPKLSLWTDNNLWAFYRAWADAVGLTPADRAVGLAPAGTGSVGYVYAVLFPLLHGATSVLLERWSPAEALALLERERATLAAAVPTQIVKLLREPAAATTPLPHLRVVTSAGAPLAPELAAKLERTWDCRIQTVYGATDGGVPLMTRIDDPDDRRHATVGRVVPHTDLRLADRDGDPVAPGEVGELRWRGPTKTFGYLGDPECTREKFGDDGLYLSGDLAMMDAEGYVRVVGRADDMIIRGAQNIAPRQVEEAVAQHPAVSEVAVVGVSDAVYGERVCAAVALHEGAALDLPSLVEFLRTMSLPTFALPERLEVFSELPKNAAGKIGAAAVRELVLERRLRTRGSRRSRRSSGR